MLTLVTQHAVTHAGLFNFRAYTTPHSCRETVTLARLIWVNVFKDLSAEKKEVNLLWNQYEYLICAIVSLNPGVSPNNAKQSLSHLCPTSEIVHIVTSST